VASFMGCMNIVIFLLQHEANPDVPTVRGETPLHLAARANQTDIIRILLRNGAKVDARARVSRACCAFRNRPSFCRFFDFQPVNTACLTQLTTANTSPKNSNYNLDSHIHTNDHSYAPLYTKA